MVQIVYNNANDKLYGTDKLISINSNKEEEQIREMGDYTFDFSKLAMAASSDKVKEIRYYTEISNISDAIAALKQPKFKSVKLL